MLASSSGFAIEMVEQNHSRVIRLRLAQFLH